MPSTNSLKGAGGGSAIAPSPTSSGSRRATRPTPRALERPDGGRGLLLKAASANFTRLHLQTLQLRVRPEHYERKLLLCLLRCMGMFSRGGEGESTERPSRVHALFSLAHLLLGAAESGTSSRSPIGEVCSGGCIFWTLPPISQWRPTAARVRRPATDLPHRRRR